MENNTNQERKNNIVGVGEHSFMNECYFGSLAKINGSHIIKFLQSFIDCKGDIGISYAKNDNGEIEAMLAIPFKANRKSNGFQQKKGNIPIPGYSSGNDQLNDNVMRQLNKIRLNIRPILLEHEDAVIFRLDFAALVIEMMNPSKGYNVSIEEIKLQGGYDIVAIVSVYRSNNNQSNKMTRILQKNSGRFNNSGGQKYNRRK